MTSALINDLQRDRADALALFAADPKLLAQPYAPGKWSARHVLIHLADAVGVQFDRLRRLQADAKPLLWAFDPDRWASHLHYEQRDLKLSSALFAANLDAITEIAHLTQADCFARSGVHSEKGTVDFSQVLSFVHWHTRHHLDQAQAAVAGTIWKPSA